MKRGRFREDANAVGDEYDRWRLRQQCPQCGFLGVMREYTVPDGGLPGWIHMGWYCEDCGGIQE